MRTKRDASGSNQCLPDISLCNFFFSKSKRPCPDNDPQVVAQGWNQGVMRVITPLLTCDSNPGGFGGGGGCFFCFSPVMVLGCYHA